MKAAVRAYRPEDLARVLRLWESDDDAWPGRDASTRLLSDGGVIVVAEQGDALVGGAVVGGVGWIWRTAATSGEVESQLLEALETALAGAGARLLAAPTNDGTALTARGFRPTGAVVYQREAAEVGAPAVLSELGGRMIPSGLWDDLRGMDEAKEIIERRVILPLAEPELAERHAVEPPKAIVLFGPPGTG